MYLYQARKNTCRIWLKTWNSLAQVVSFLSTLPSSNLPLEENFMQCCDDNLVTF